MSGSVVLRHGQRASQCGSGLTNGNSDVVIAIRNIRLIDRSFMKAGYIMVQIEKSYFQLTDEVDGTQSETRELMKSVR